jgi:uncharacterized DUF497 family protein
MAVVFDPAKNASNVTKHGISLQRAEDIDLVTAIFKIDDAHEYRETRFVAIGFIRDVLFHFTFTERNGDTRAISLRKATRQEQKEYDEAQ